MYYAYDEKNTFYKFTTPTARMEYIALTSGVSPVRAVFFHYKMDNCAKRGGAYRIIAPRS
jgi:hypothetical protein